MTLVGSWIIQIVIGCEYAVGKIIVYFVSYFRSVRGLRVDEDTFYLIGPMIIILAGIFYPLGNKLINFFRGKSRPAILVVGTTTVLLNTFTPTSLSSLTCLSFSLVLT